MALPPAPVQVNVKVDVAESGPTGSMPDVALVPLQLPDPVQLVAFWLDQVKVLLPFAPTEVGLALRVILGTPVISATPTLTDLDALPPDPVQLKVNVDATVSEPIVWLPVVALLPDHAPDAVQDVAFAAVQASTVDPPDVTDVGFADSVIAGAGVALATVIVA